MVRNPIDKKLSNMKHRCILPFMLLCAALACLTSCEKIAKIALDKAMATVTDHNYTDSEEWGKVVTKKLDLSVFDRIDLRGAVRLEYTQDSLCRVEVYGNEKAIEAYEIVVKNGELVATLTKNGSNIDKNSARITLRVAAPQLLKATCSGASQMVVENVEQQDDLRLVVAGAGEVKMTDCILKNLEVSINGAGETAFKEVKVTEDVELLVSGAGELAGDISCRNLKVNLSGAGESFLVIESKDVNVSCAGSTTLSLTGHCNTFSQSSSGTSKVMTETLNIDKE